MNPEMPRHTRYRRRQPRVRGLFCG